ncbi:MAG: adenylate/guanylate cyclase domain-containing protein [Gammaproteobacteria bacterium]|nr:adenylate/guanylate cyclase domain-containing protein [Gammaproteobacteria bacterium]MDH3886977.1 adenylate/guanylate cyclase domain-containing protein [Gammaproteobacteria bacterium]MDH3933684.1 adenylate/guanylate cyclase domain-containing protein [Gammaproteobacteria bacterium]MDH3985613.1 adenylate/guanylate cyclase domain-containing protein [Gammaproteobacteria bacterium]
MNKQITLSKIHESPRIVGILIGLCIALLVILVRNNGGLQFLDLESYDLLLSMRASKAVAESRVVLVSGSEEDIQTLGEWPMSDMTLDRVFERLTAAGARAIGLDIYRDMPIPPGSSELQQTLLGNDRIIVVKKFGSHDSPGVKPPAYMEGSGRVGFTDTVVDADGIVRRSLLFLDDESGVSYGLSLRLALLYLADEDIWPQAGEPDPSYIRLGEVTLPPFEPDDGPYINADAAGYQLLLSYSDGVDAFPVIGLVDLLAGNIADEVFRDRIVIVGISADSVKDAFFTPISTGLQEHKSVPGAMVHAYLASQLVRAGMDGEQILKTVSERYQLSWILLWGLLGSMAGLFVRSFPRLVLLSISGVAVIAATSWWAFQYGWWFSLIGAAVSWLLSASLVTAYLSGYERLQRGLLMELFSKHVSSDVADEIWKNRDQYFSLGRLRSQELTVTVIFTDIEHFTTISEKLDPEALMDWLNNYMELMANMVIKCGGVVDDYHGDAIKADFGVPIARTTAEQIRLDAINAVNCALGMKQELEKYNQKTREQGLPNLRMRVGISTGTVVAGCLGSSERMKYTTIGDTINTAARIETLDKESFNTSEESSDCRILVAESTMNYIKGTWQAEPAGSVVLRGKTRPVTVYRVDTCVAGEVNHYVPGGVIT